MMRVGALVIALLVALAGCSSGEHRVSAAAAPSAASTSVRPSSTTTSEGLAFDVPWIDRLASQPIPDAPVPTTLPPTGARPCAASDVSVTAEESDGASGTTHFGFAFKNVGQATCELGGYPSRVLGIPSGRASVLAQNGTYFPETGPPGNISPGQAAAFSVETSIQCHDLTPRPEPISGAAVVTMSGGGDVTLPGTFDLTCGLSTGKFGLPQPPRVYPPKWFLGLTVSLTVPAVVDAGSTLAYVMTLGNSTTHAIRFVGCPGYAEGVFGPHIEVTAFYALNCDRVRAIPASSGVRYEMRLRIPKDTPTGDVSLQLMTLIDAEAPTAKARLHVQGNG